MNADELVSRWLIREYRGDGDDKHLRACAGLTVDWEGVNGTYGCETGCEYATLEALMTCPHGARDEYTYGEFGDLPSLIESIAEEAARTLR